MLFGENKQKEISILKEEMCNKFNREIENNKRIHKEYSIEVKDLKLKLGISNHKCQAVTLFRLNVIKVPLMLLPLMEIME